MPTRDELTNGETPERGTFFVLTPDGARFLNDMYQTSLKEGDRIKYPGFGGLDGKGREKDLFMHYFTPEGKYLGGFQVPGNVDLFSEMITPGKERK